MPESNSLKRKTISGAFWKFFERVFVQLSAFIVSIILARLLLPEDYGVVVLISVFITICDKIIICGFSTALIQKKEVDDIDYSTVLYFSLFMSILLYAILYFSAPSIALFYSSYDSGLLIKVLRVMGMNFFIIAINSVQHAYVSREMRFKNYFWSVSGGTFLSAVVAIYMAYKGFGVWALVVQYLVMNICDTLILWFTVKWRPIFCFSKERFKRLFSYSWKIFVASMVRTVYNDLRSLIIGKMYSPASLAYYNKGQSFPQMLDTTVSGTIDSVFFPAISKMQTSPQEMKSMLRRTIRVSSMMMMPLMAGFAAVASPLVNILLTDKWMPCVPFIQILSFSFILSSVEIENLQAIKAIGRSDLVLKLEIVKKTIGVVILLLSVFWGIKAIAYGVVLSQVIAAIVNTLPNKDLLGYSVASQIMDVLPYLSGSILMSVLILLCSHFWMLSPVWDLLCRLVVGVIFYILFLMLIKDDSLQFFLKTIKEYRGNA